MSIVAMKRLRAIVPKDNRRKLLRMLYKLGCVEVEQSESPLTVRENAENDKLYKSVQSALLELNRICPYKKGLLSPKREVSEKTLFSQEEIDEAVKTAEEINKLSYLSTQAADDIVKAENAETSLLPWKDLEVPLGYSGSRSVTFCCGLLSARTDKEALFTETDALCAEVKVLSADADQLYVSVTVHKSDEDKLFDILKKFGFSKVNFRENGTAASEIERCRMMITGCRRQIEQNRKKIAAFAESRTLLENASDALLQEASRDDVLSGLDRTRETVLISGWLPASDEKKVSNVLTDYGCAFEMNDPQEGDDVPTALKNSKFVAPFNMITEMYGMPDYNSIVDPNPLIMPFYIVFFGFIMADLGYGLLIFLGCLLGLKLMKPKGGTKALLTLFMYCGVSSAICGALLGGFFADLITVFSETFLGRTISMPVIWFDPLKDPMTMLIFSLILGAIQILTGMAISGYRQIKRGDVWGAIFDVGSWYLIFGGLAVWALLGSQIALYVCIGGVVLLLCTAGRANKGFGKVTGGLGALYGVTGYFSDLLSYSRIMALALSGAVVGQVVNKMGAIGGSGIVGLICFILVFLIGHVFNIAISILGAYVHTSRLQYVEYFGRFYEGGGRVFKPVTNKTKYVEIRKD